jgi:hypothetical protein
MKYPSCSKEYCILSGGSFVKSRLVLALIAVMSTSVMLVSAEVAPSVSVSGFDMSGTIMDVLSPSSILVGNKEINLESVDASELNSAAYAFLMRDLKDWLIGKDVFVKGNRVYFDLNGAYNSVSINEQIQKEIDDLVEEQNYYLCYYYGRC